MNNLYIYRRLLPAIIAAFCLAGCSDDDALPGAEGEDMLELTYELPVVESHGRYYSFTVTPGDAGNVEITSDVDWLHLTSSTLPADGIVEFRTDDNDDVAGRRATLVFRAPDLRKRAAIEIYQRGEGDYDDNADTDVMSDYRVGWGFNAFGEYKNRNSVQGRIIDTALMGGIDSDSTFQSVQEVIRGSEKFEIVSAFSMQEMSSHLTKKMEKTSSFLGVKKTIRRFKEVTSHDLSESYMAYARLYKIVSSRSIDRGVLEYLVATYGIEDLPFTQGFKEQYKKVLDANSSTRRDKIKNMVNTYGTHLVIEALAGGSIDYVVTFDRTYASEFEKDAEEQCSRVFGKSTGSSSSSSHSVVTSSMSNDYTFSIAGGTADTRAALKNAISGLSDTGALPNNLLQEWLSTVVYTPSNKKNLDIIDFNFMPIWDLFADPKIRAEVQDVVAEMSNQSNNMYTDQELGIDNYVIDLTSKDFTFPADGSGSLVKVMYSNGTPLLEICSEYVPKIRTDRRVTVFYPIKNGRTSHSQGLFPGDGEGNRPAFVSFYENTCYVEPIEGFGYYDRITTAYCMHGNLYEQGYGVKCRPAPDTKTLPHQLQFNASNIKYDVVKIGSGYWTRRNIMESMYFGTLSGRSFTRRERIYNDGNADMLYAYILNQRSAFLSANSDFYGSKREPSVDMALYWYLPTEHDKENLTDYIGRNTKSLFKGGTSGFDAQFCGYFSTGTSSPTDNTNCYIAFKESAKSTTKGYALVLKPDYTWDTQVISGINKMYPVRLFRTRYFTYPNL